MAILGTQPGVGPLAQATPVAANLSTQENLGQMIGEILSWNPDWNSQDAIKSINNHYRKLVDKRLWAGLMVRGQVSVPSIFSYGTATVTQGSPTVSIDLTGFSQTISQSFVGYQFRVGFQQPIYNIIAVGPGTGYGEGGYGEGPYGGGATLTLDLPWGDPSVTGTSYQVFNNYVQLGYNVKMILEFVNQWQGYRCYTGIQQSVINKYDTWRTAQGWTFLVSPKEFNPQTGAQFFELYPLPTFQQSFPFLVYVQPPDLVNDEDAMYPFIRADIVVKLAICDALLIGGPKQNRYYDQFTAQWKAREAQYDLTNMELMDDNLYEKDLQWDQSTLPFSEHGSTWLQQHSGEEAGW